MTAAEAAVAILEHKGVKHVWGMAGELVTEVEQMDAALERAFAEDRPYLLEIVVDRDAKCSMSPDGSLHTINYYTE